MDPREFVEHNGVRGAYLPGHAHADTSGFVNEMNIQVYRARRVPIAAPHAGRDRAAHAAAVVFECRRALAGAIENLVVASVASARAEDALAAAPGAVVVDLGAMERGREGGAIRGGSSSSKKRMRK